MEGKKIIDLRLVATGDDVMMETPTLDREMTVSEIFLASVFTIWVAGHEGDSRAIDLVDKFLTLANEILSDVPPERETNKPS